MAHLEAELTPLRKISVAMAAGRRDLGVELIVEAGSAGVPPRLIDHVTKTALGMVEFNLSMWDEYFATLNPEEQRYATTVILPELEKARHPSDAYRTCSQCGGDCYVKTLEMGGLGVRASFTCPMHGNEVFV